MEIVKAFNDNNLHTEILIKGTVNEPLFRASDIGEILEMGNIRSTIQHFDNTEKHVHSMDTSTGPKQVTFLTEKGLYKVLFKSRKPIAERFQNWVCEVIKEIRLNGVYDLQKQLEKQKTELQLLEENKNKETEEKLIKQKELEREKYLLKQFATSGPLVYIIKVKSFEDKTYIVKIGESRIGVQNRYTEHKSKYEECLLLDCFNVDKSKEFETFLHHHTNIYQTKVNNLQNHEKENELFLIGKELTYCQLLKIIDDNINNYNYKVRELLLEIENLKLKNTGETINNDNELIKELVQSNKILTTKIISLETSMQQILNKLNEKETKVVTGFNQQLPNLGPRLQKINPENLQLIKVYESVTEAMNENKNIKRPSIMKAIDENTIYCGFRWLLVERNLDPNIIYNIEATKETKVQNLGYIAKLNSDKSEILNVYLDRKTAAELNDYQSSSALDNPVKNGIITKGHYYILYNNCDEDLINNFETKINGTSLLYKNGIGQFDLHNNLIKEFACKYDCIRELKISDKTLNKSLENNIPYNGSYYKVLGSKLKCI
jgi:prophage antirepressor-like protein